MIARGPLRRSANFLSISCAASRRMSGFNRMSPGTLDEIVKKELFANEPVDRIKSIWEEYHESKESSVGMHIPGDRHEKIVKRLEESSFFVLPIFKDNIKESYLMLLSQLQGSFVALTYLEDYKKDPMNAKAWQSTILYDDFVKEKDLTLIRSDFNPYLTKEESVNATKSLIHLYEDDEAYARYVSVFNHQPDDFDYQAYIDYIYEMQDE